MSKQRIVKLAKFTAGVAILLCLTYPLRADHRGVDLISDALPFGRLWYP